MPIDFGRRCRCELTHDFAFFIRTDEGNEVFEHRAFLHEGASLDHVGFRLDQATHSTTNYTTQLLHRELTIGERLASSKRCSFELRSLQLAHWWDASPRACKRSYTSEKVSEKIAVRTTVAIKTQTKG